MLTVHHLENSRSQRILWLLEELGVDYAVKRYERDPKTGLAPPALEQVHPLGKSPVLTDGDTTVAESGAIVEYLCDRFDDGILRPPPGSPERLAFTYWLHYAEGSFMPLMVLSLIMHRIETASVPFFIKPITRGVARQVRQGYLDENVTRHLTFMNDSLADRDWFLGDSLSAADIQMSFPLEAAEVRTDLRQRYPHLAGFLEHARSRPAYQAALAKGGPYSLG